jgi:Ca2+/Na+ antiporter
MLVDATILAILSAVGLIALFAKLPRQIRRFLLKHAVFTDFITFFLTYYTLGGTLTALTAGAIVGIITSALMYIASNPNDFLYLYDFYGFLKNKVQDLKEHLNEYGQRYREQRSVSEMPVS